MNRVDAQEFGNNKNNHNMQSHIKELLLRLPTAQSGSIQIDLAMSMHYNKMHNDAQFIHIYTMHQHN